MIRNKTDAVGTATMRIGGILEKKSDNAVTRKRSDVKYAKAVEIVRQGFRDYAETFKALAK